MSKKSHITIFATTLFVLIFQLNLVAQKHNIYLSGLAGYTSLRTDATNISSSPQLGFGVGAGYEFNYKKFVAQVGVENTYLNAKLNHHTISFSKDLIDSEGDSYIGNFNLSNNFEKYKYSNLNFPLLVGLRLSNLYVLTGVKLGLNLSLNSQTSTTITSTGTYPNFIDEFENMPDHYFTTWNETSDYKTPFNFNTCLSGEIGLNIKSSTEKYIIYRISAFVDYGLSNLNTEPGNQSLVLEKQLENEPYTPYLNSFLLSETMNDRFIKNLFAGVKLTVLFGIPEQEPCNCEDTRINKRIIRGKKVRFKR